MSILDPTPLTVDAANKSFDRKGDVVFKPEAFGAKGDGIADDTAAVRAAFDAANAKARAGIVGGIQHPGGTVQLTGAYNLATLTVPIEIKCNVTKNQATFMVPASYAGVSVLVGHATSGGYFTDADISLPDIVKPNNTAPVAGSVAIRVQNVGNSILTFGRTYYHETGIHFTGLGQGTVYNQFFLGHISYCKVAVLIKPLAGGWANQNTFIGGGIQQSPNYDGGGERRAGWRHVVIDGGGINACDMNTFIGTSFEGDASEYHIELRQAVHNKFRYNRFEQGTLGADVTVSGATLTRAGHGLTVGDMVTFTATATPGGMFLAAGYYVTATPTADTFSVSLKKGGGDVTFTTAGTAVKYFRPPRILIDSTGSLTANNTVESFFAVQGVIEVVDPVGAATGNVVHPSGTRIADNYIEADLPPFRGRNRYGSATTRAIYAAYPPGTNPVQNPLGWTAGVSDRGLVFAASEAETGLVSNPGGVLSYKRPADPVTYELPSARRTPGLITITGLSCAANTTTTTTFTLTDAAVNDHVNITMLNHVAGIAVSHGYVSAANTITVVFANLTAAPISLSTTLQAMATRRFF